MKDGITNINETIMTTANLKSLRLEFSDCSGIMNGMIRLLTKGISGLILLESFHFGVKTSMFITDDGIKGIIYAIQSLENLKTISFKIINIPCLIRGSAIQAMKECFSNLCKLQSLSLHSEQCYALGREGGHDRIEKFT